MSYSQNNEESLILEAVGSTVGRFLDIGANDGWYLSNTLALVERGWSGVMVEPNPWSFERLYARHENNSKLTLVNAAVGSEWGMTRFWPAVLDDVLSTTEEAQRERRADQAGFGKPFWVPTIPLSALLENSGIESAGPIDVLSIDTEGTSGRLFLEFPLWEYLPTVVVMEHDGDPDVYARFAAKGGYRIAGVNAENLVLVR